ncbi:aldehyde dehydrogenase family protein [Butyricicoccus sp. 1XD8-22]|nr:aldehyde dehydrogenase family protein [Butyricicoccus sp. 1XD8-22]
MVEKYGHFIDGKWIEAGEIIPVTNKYTGDTYGEIHEADESIVNKAVQNAYESFEKNELSAEDRFTILNKAVTLIDERKLELAELLIYEAGKTRKDAVTEIERGISTLRASAEEAKRITGQGVALPNSADKGKLAFTVRVPVGVVVAITPFNFPFNLTVHKIGPALAAGNAVVLKPAEMTPLIACKLVEIFKEAGLPDGLFNLVNGRGTQTGEYLLKNSLVDMYTFTGSPKVGQLIKSKTGIRKVALELGNNSPNIVHKDVDDLKRAAELCVSRGFSNAGQACISVQRIYVHEEVYDQFLKYATEFTKSLVLCSEDNPDGDVGPVISEREATRIESWIEEAVQQGAKIIVGGQRKRSQFEPTILADVSQSMKVVCEEIFGPVITIQKYQEIDDVLHKANDSTMGLQVGIFTSNIQIVMKSIKKLKFGGVIVNNVSTYREDVMPYGGVKNSGIGKEGPKYAILEMTEEKLIVLDA